MTSENVTSLCRICLQEGATCPIFDNKENGINCKLRECFKEKLEDTEGYPRNICRTCNDTLDTVYDFINRYKQSQKILEGGLSVIQESKDNSSNLETYKFTSKSEDSEILQSEITIVKTECLDTFELSDSDNDHDKDDFMYELQIDNLNVESKDAKEPCLIKKDPAEILGALSHLTVKKIKAENESESQQRDNSWSPGKLKTKKNGTNKQVKGKQKSKTSVKPTKPNEGISKEQLRLKKLKLQQEIEEQKKRAYLEQQHTAKLCDLCGDTYTSTDQLAKHKRQKHAERKFKCSQCTKDYRCEKDLKDHVSRQHENIRTAVCDLCGKAFFTKKHLKQHVVVTHEKRKRPPSIRKCQYCERTFTYKRGVVIHERSVHTGERPSKCTICDGAFYDDVYLAEHMRIHTGYAPYKCPVCAQGFTQRGNMKSHMRNHKISELDEETKSRVKPNHFKFMRP